MIRERRLSTLAFQAGQRTTVEIPKDAVFHQFQLNLEGYVDVLYGAAGAGNTQFMPGFPFTLINQIRVIRNGSDVVWQGSGSMLAKETLYNNHAAPLARIQAGGDSTAGFAFGNLLTATTSGVVTPANAAGIAENSSVFNNAAVVSRTQRTLFQGLGEIWFQLAQVDSNFWSTLVDARNLASFIVEITWENPVNVIIPGTDGGVPAVTASIAVLSYDQDNITPSEPFGTFKRSTQNISQVQWGSQGVQFLLSRGNLYAGIIFETLAYKTGLTLPRPEQAVIQEFYNRINVNYFLRDTTFISLQAKNRDDMSLALPYQAQSGSPRGWAYLNYLSVGQRIGELVQTYTMDQFDLAINLSAIGAAQNGANDPAYQPIVNIMTQEVIPGKSVAPNASQGAQAGSIARTSASPGGR